MVNTIPNMFIHMHFISINRSKMNIKGKNNVKFDVEWYKTYFYNVSLKVPLVTKILYKI